MSVESTFEVYSTLSGLLHDWVLPEIAARKAEGRITGVQAPLELRTFRVVQVSQEGDQTSGLVEINQEVELRVAIKTKKPVQKGQLVTTDDVDPEECWMDPVELNGTPCPSVLWQRLYLNSFLYFSRPGGQRAPGEGFGSLKFPLAELIRTSQFCEVVKPEEKLDALERHNWPPAPCYFPSVFSHLHKHPNAAGTDGFLEVVSRACPVDYWDRQLRLWDKCKLFQDRRRYIATTIARHFARDYASSIYVIVPQFEGVIRAYLEECGVRVPAGFPCCVDTLRQAVLSRDVIIFPRQVLDRVLEHLKGGCFWRSSSAIADPSLSVNRHGIVHGAFAGFECESISLKYLILFESLAFILMHDRVLRGALPSG
jgi:hypothetical protein